jgi:FkbM family methyltransferase
MSVLDLFKQSLPQELRQSLKRKLFAVHDMATRLANLRRAGFVCSGAVDGGAYRGGWSRDFWSVYPDAPTILVDPLPEVATSLRELAAKRPPSTFHAVALGSASGRVTFRRDETNSAIVSPDKPTSASISVPVVTIDELLRGTREFVPNLLKLDLQGHEIEALKGCSKLAASFEVIVTEVSILRIGDVPIFHELDGYLDGNGFRLYDFIPQYYRPKDGALWQGDAFYVRHDSPLIASREWA